MNKLFQIPLDKVDSLVKSIIRQKTILIVLALMVCILLEMQGNRDFHLMGFKNLSKFESWLLVDAIMFLYMLFLVKKARQRFTVYYTGYRILLTHDGIKKYNVTSDLEDEPKAILFFNWDEIKRIKETSAGLKVLNGLSMLIPGTRQIVIPNQIASFDLLKSEIETHTK